MLKDFIKKIQNLEEGERRHLLTILVIVSTVFVFALWMNQIKSIFENQSAETSKKSAAGGLPSVKENVKSSVKELRNIFSGLNSRLKSQVFPEPQAITPAPPPAGGPAAYLSVDRQDLPPAVKLPE